MTQIQTGRLLTVESIVDDLTRSNDEDYVAMLEDRRKWLNEMFHGLAAGPGKNPE